MSSRVLRFTMVLALGVAGASDATGATVACPAGNAGQKKPEVTIQTALQPGVNAIRVQLAAGQKRGDGAAEGAAAGSGAARDEKTEVFVVVTAKDGELAKQLCDPPKGECVALLERSLAIGEELTIEEMLGEVVTHCTQTRVKLPGSFDWGRVQGLFTGGVVLSKSRADFSETDPVLASTVIANWISIPESSSWSWLSGYSYVDVRLTSVSTEVPATREPADPNGGPMPPDPPAPETEPGDDPEFIDQPKAAVLEIGGYLPIRVGHWEFAGERNALFAAPMFKFGRETIREEMAVQLDDDLTGYWGFGLRLGHHQGGGPGHMPKLLSYVDLVVGKWERFEIDGEKPWRWGFEGRILVPGGLAIGATVNFGHGRDDFRLLITKTVDLGEILGPLL